MLGIEENGGHCLEKYFLSKGNVLSLLKKETNSTIIHRRRAWHVFFNANKKVEQKPPLDERHRNLVVSKVSLSLFDWSL